MFVKQGKNSVSNIYETE